MEAGCFIFRRRAGNDIVRIIEILIWARNFMKSRMEFES